MLDKPSSSLIVIPARGGSKRFPGKNLCLLGGIPMLAHSILYAQKELPEGAVYVSTDSEEIAAVARQYGAGVVIRPEALSDDYCPTAPVIEHAARELAAQGVPFDYVVTLQPTNPLRPEGMLSSACSMLSASIYDSLFTVSPSTRKLGRIEQDCFIPWNYTFGQRSQDMEPLYYENGLLYISCRKTILRGQLFGDALYPLVIDHIYGTLDIDTREDLEWAEYLLSEK